MVIERDMQTQSLLQLKCKTPHFPTHVIGIPQ